MEQTLTAEQSLKLIDDMMRQAKRSFHRMSFYFLLWGVLLIGAMLTEYFMDRAGHPFHGKSWGVVGIIGGIVSSMHGARQGKKEGASTAMDRVMMWLWAAFVITMLVTIIGYGVSGGGTPAGSIMVLTGLPTFVSGQLMRFKPLIFGGILFWVLGALSYFVDPQMITWLYVGAMLFGYVIPGYMLKRQEDVLRAA
ncbi:MAG: hypothetical protein ABI432_01355 [Flavobacteriales bacterium]